MSASALKLEAYRADDHYPLIQAWWQARGDKALPKDVLPPTGAVVTRNGAPIAVCSIWLTNAAAAYLAFPMTAPGLSPKIAYAAVELSVRGAVDYARTVGCKWIWAAAENRGVDRIITRNLGFTRVTPLNNYFLMLDPSVAHDTLVGKDFPEQKG